jgi:hypothetical protein
MILKRICLMVAFKDYPQTSSYSWEYRGGCYGSGEIGIYEKGIPGTQYSFDHVPIEVREDESLYVVAGNISSQARNSVASILLFLAKLCIYLSLLTALVAAILFLLSLKKSLSQPGMSHAQQVDVE